MSGGLTALKRGPVDLLLVIEDWGLFDNSNHSFWMMFLRIVLSLTFRFMYRLVAHC